MTRPRIVFAILAGLWMAPLSSAIEPPQRSDSGPTADAPATPPVAPTADEGQQLDAFGGPTPRPAGA